ncbi:hypothetical protein D0815_22995 [Vibrio parahaemolyticus]|nr:hypothetical protein [Vibrio parahaemolyticus]
MFTAQWFRLGGRRCSPLNAALYAFKFQTIKGLNNDSKSRLSWRF